MRISVRDVDRLVSYPVGYVGRAVAHVDQNRDVAMAEVVHADPLYSRYLAAPVHLIAEIFPGQTLEDPLIVRDMEEEPDVFFYLLRQEPRYPEPPVGLLRLRWPDDVLAASPVHGFAYIEVAVLEIEVRWRERQELSLPYARPVKDLEGIVRCHLVANGVEEQVELCLRPYLHLVGPLLARLLYLLDGIGIQVVVLGRVVEEGRKFAVELPHVGGGQGLPVLLPRLRQPNLPVDYVYRRDLVQGLLLEEGDDPLAQRLDLRVIGGDPDSRADVLHVDVCEVLEGQIPCKRRLSLEVVLVVVRLLLGPEAALLLPLLLFLEVLVVEERVPGSVVV